MLGPLVAGWVGCGGLLVIVGHGLLSSHVQKKKH